MKHFLLYLRSEMDCNQRWYSIFISNFNGLNKQTSAQVSDNESVEITKKKKKFLSNKKIFLKVEIFIVSWFIGCYSEFTQYNMSAITIKKKRSELSKNIHLWTINSQMLKAK